MLLISTPWKQMEEKLKKGHAHTEKSKNDSTGKYFKSSS